MQKECKFCEKSIDIGYRIQVERGGSWIFVCGKCCLSAKKGSHYRYGGTWKSKERRKGMIV